MSGRSKPLGKVLDHPWYIVLAISAVALVAWVVSTRHQSHYVKASFSSAFNLAPGLDVQIDGRDIGKLGKVEYQPDGTTLVDLGIDDDDSWPLPVDSTAISRYGTTIGSGTRYIDITPGKSSQTLPEDGIIPMKFTEPVVDVDEVINVFTKTRRAEVQSLTDRIDKGLEGQAVNDAIKEAGPAVNSASSFLSELGADNVALRGLITNTRKTMGNLSSRSETVKDLVTATAAVFDEFAQNTEGMEQALVEAPATFSEARTTLRRVDSSLGGLDALMTDLRPGAKALQPLARAATPALRELRATVPSGVATVRAVRQASPGLRRLLTEGQPFASQLGEVSEKLAPQVACIRPYAPEAASSINGLAGWTQAYEHNRNYTESEQVQNHPTRYDSQVIDGDGSLRVHGLRATAVFSARSLHNYNAEVTPEIFSKLTGTFYAMPRPAGLATGNPWFMPECGTGPDVLDPAKDKE